jgi:hypothetical protein
MLGWVSWLLLVCFRLDDDFSDKLTVPVTVVKDHPEAICTLHLHGGTRHYTLQEAGLDKSEQAFHINIAYFLVDQGVVVLKGTVGKNIYTVHPRYLIYHKRAFGIDAACKSLHLALLHRRLLSCATYM